MGLILAIWALIVCSLFSSLTAITEDELDGVLKQFEADLLDGFEILNVNYYEEGRGNFGNSLNFPQLSGFKRVVIRITFKKPFPIPPVVLFTVYGIDAQMNAKISKVAYARDITETGFEAVCETWSGQINAIWYHWIAISR
ncbi:uncharacterized protein LOC131943597 [Physella acuta]|uniref:uncharacterized protein LOC131943597 n=1 Tax=Physella acuta TaxID=109671 RepID=UPI0027DB9072|nr:uncharacterized protein LOC131943597 [Physella acuta]